MAFGEDLIPVIIKVYYNKRFDRETTDAELLESYRNKEKAQEIIDELIENGIYRLPISGVSCVGDYIIYKTN